MTTATHALKDKWLVSFLPLLTSDMVNTDFKGDWKLAAQKRMQKLDWVTSVEELWSTMNSLPRIQQMGVGSTMIFSRNGKDPSFEAFPNGSRVVVNLHKTPATEVGLEIVLATVLGETVTASVSSGNPVCDVIRIAGRSSREFPDLLRVEVWLNDQSHSTGITSFIRSALREKDLTSNLFTIAENPFDAPSAKKLSASASMLSPSSVELVSEQPK